MVNESWNEIIDFQQIIDIIREEGKPISAREIRKRMNLGDQHSYKLSTILHEFVREEVLISTGHTRATRYSIKKAGSITLDTIDRVIAKAS